MKNRCTLFAILFLNVTNVLFAQSDLSTVHELQLKLSTYQHDTVKIKTYLKLGILYSRNNYDSAYYFTVQGLNLSKNKSYKKGILRGYVQLGTILKNKGDYKQSLKYLKKALPLASRPNDLGTIYNNLGSTYLKLGILDSALSNMQRSLDIKISIHDEDGIVNSYINLGNFHFAERQFTEAKDYFIKGLKIEERLNDPARLSKLYINLGNVYYETATMDSAEYTYKKALSIQRNKNDLVNFISVYINLGNIYQHRGEVKSALSFYKKSLELSNQIGDSHRVISSLQNIGNIYKTLKEYKKAITYYENAFDVSRKIISKDQQKALLFNISMCYERLSNYALAYQYYLKADSLADNLYNEEREGQIAEMQAKFKTEQKEKELVVQKAVNEKKISERNAFIFTSILLFALLSIVILIYVKTKRVNKTLAIQKKTIEKREHEKGLLLRELHHRAKNNLQLVSSLLNLQAHQLKDTEAADAVKEGQARVEAMALIHRDLYRRENVTKVNLKTYLGNMVDNLMSSYNFSPSSISLVMDVSDIEMEADLAIPLGLIANELISNAFKHAFANQQHPELTIVAGEMTENELHLLVQDNGLGIKNGSSKEESFGVTMIHSLVKQLQGSIAFENSNGCIATLVVSLRKDELVEI